MPTFDTPTKRHRPTATYGQCALGDRAEVARTDRILVRRALESVPAITAGGVQIARQMAGAAGDAGSVGSPAAGTADAGTAVPPAGPQPQLTVARQGGAANTFVSTDSISLVATVSGSPDAGTLAGQVAWTVQGVSTDSGNGNPHSAANQNAFVFTPNPINRPTTGAAVANDPIRYRVDARVGSITTSHDLTQDQADIVRQEYIDFGAVPPHRSEVVAPAIATFNTGNYSVIVDRGMNNALTNTQAQFQTLTQLAAAPAPGTASPDAGVPAPAPGPAISVTSGYRNPRRNVHVGSVLPVTSRHVWGSALDLGVAGANATLWDRLRLAGANAGTTSICEHGPTQLPCNDPTINHVHIQW